MIPFAACTHREDGTLSRFRRLAVASVAFITQMCPTTYDQTNNTYTIPWRENVNKSDASEEGIEQNTKEKMAKNVFDILNYWLLFL